MGDADTTPQPESKPPGEKDPPLTPEEGTKKLKLNDEQENTSSVVLPDNNNVVDTSLEQEVPPPPEPSSSPPPPELTKPFTVQVMYNKQPYQLEISETMTVLQLKNMIKEKTGVDPGLQKVLLKGIAKDEAVLKGLGVSSATKKILVIGSTIEDVMKMKQVPSEKDEKGGSEDKSGAAGNWCSLVNHKKVIDKGLPDDVMPGILNEHDPLPPFPLYGMYSSKGSKVRLTFKLENDELWIGTKERTEKVPIGTIRNVLSQPITGYEHYHILAIQLGPTEASRFFVYWVPAQYVEAIKDALTGA